MKIGEFWHVLAISAVVAAIMWAYTPEVHPLLLLGLVALSCAGYFALVAIRKAGFAAPKAEYAFLVCTFGCFLLAGLMLYSLSSVSKLVVFPVMFSISALLSLARNFAEKLLG